MRKTRFFQRDAYISIDYLTKEVEVAQIKNVDPEAASTPGFVIDLGPGKAKRQILFNKPAVNSSNAIKSELESFYHSIVNDTTPPVTIIDGYNALEVAHKIMEKIDQSATNL